MSSYQSQVNDHMAELREERRVLVNAVRQLRFSLTQMNETLLIDETNPHSLRNIIIRTIRAEINNYNRRIREISHEIEGYQNTRVVRARFF